MADRSGRSVQIASARFHLTGDPSLLEAARRFIYPLPVEPLPSDEPVRLLRTESGARAETSFGTFEAPSDEELLERLDYELTCQALARETGEVTALHAACLAHASGALLVCGPHLSGKSTLGVALSRLGFRLLSDDLTLVRSRPVGVRPLSRVVRVRPDVAPMVGGDPGVGGTHRLVPAEPGPAWFVPSACVVVKFFQGSAPRMTRPGTHEALVSLVRSTFGFSARASDCLDDLAALAASAPVHQLEYGGSPAEGARFVAEQLELRP